MAAEGHGGARPFEDSAHLGLSLRAGIIGALITATGTRRRRGGAEIVIAALRVVAGSAGLHTRGQDGGRDVTRGLRPNRKAGFPATRPKKRMSRSALIRADW